MARKYRKGRLITSIDELSKQDFIYMNDKIYHQGWFQSWPLRTIMIGLENNRLYSAIKNQGKPRWIAYDGGDPIFYGSRYICSNCGRVVPVREKHCPECGENMRERGIWRV